MKTCLKCSGKYRDWDVQDPFPLSESEKQEAIDASINYCVPCADPKFSSLENSKDWLNRTKGVLLFGEAPKSTKDVKMHQLIGGKKCFACFNCSFIPAWKISVKMSFNDVVACLNCNRVRPIITLRTFFYKKDVYNAIQSANFNISSIREFFTRYESAPFTYDENELTFSIPSRSYPNNTPSIIHFVYPRKFCERIFGIYPPPQRLTSKDGYVKSSTLFQMVTR